MPGLNLTTLTVIAIHDRSRNMGTQPMPPSDITSLIPGNNRIRYTQSTVAPIV